MLTIDTETILTINNPEDSWIRKSFQFNNPVLKGSFFGGINKPKFGLSVEPTFFGLFGISGELTADLTKPEHSSLYIKLNENINLNDNSKSLGVGIKPVGILILYFLRGALTAPAPKEVPIPIQ